MPTPSPSKARCSSTCSWWPASCPKSVTCVGCVRHSFQQYDPDCEDQTPQCGPGAGLSAPDSHRPRNLHTANLILDELYSTVPALAQILPKEEVAHRIVQENQ